MSTTPADTEAIAAGLARRLTVGAIVCLTGPLGAGKSVFARAVGRVLGVEEPMPSPTFTIVASYEGSVPVLHIDLYRVSGPREFEDLDLDHDMTTAVSLVEWPERAPALLQHADYVVHIALLPDQRRAIRIDPRV